MSVIEISEVNKKLEKMDGWKSSKNSIYKEFELKDFSDALGFIIRVGVQAEKADHHPDINLHSWNKVKITLSTHDKGGVTNKDFKLAENIEKL